MSSSSNFQVSTKCYCLGLQQYSDFQLQSGFGSTLRDVHLFFCIVSMILSPKSGAYRKICCWELDWGKLRISYKSYIKFKCKRSTAVTPSLGYFLAIKTKFKRGIGHNNQRTSTARDPFIEF